MLVDDHNREVLRAVPDPANLAAIADVRNTICLLLRDGRLFGPFRTVADARLWAVSQELPAFSTYDLLSPLTPQGD